VRLRYPPPPNYRNANLDGSSDTRDDSNAAPPPPTTAATADSSEEDSETDYGAHQDDGSMSPSLSPRSSNRRTQRRTNTRAPWSSNPAEFNRSLRVVAGAQGTIASFLGANTGARASDERLGRVWNLEVPAPSSNPAGAQGSQGSTGREEEGEGEEEEGEDEEDEEESEESEGEDGGGEEKRGDEEQGDGGGGGEGNGEGNAEEPDGEQGGGANGEDGDMSANGNTTNQPPPDIPASTELTNNSDNNTTDDISAFSTSSTLVNQALERIVYTAADLREIGNRTLSTTAGAPTEGWERVRRPRIPPPPATTAATAVLSDEDSQPEHSEHEDSPEEDDGNGHEPYPPGTSRTDMIADFRRRVQIGVDAARSTASENRRRASRVASLDPSSAANHRNANLDGSNRIRHGSNPRPSKVAATAELSDEDSQPEHSEHEDSPEEDDGSALDPYPSGSGLGPERPWKTAGYSRRLMETADTQRAMVEFGAAEDRRRATRFARLARFSAATAAAAAGNATDGIASSNDTTASSASPNLITPVERRVYTTAGLLGIGQRIPSAPITGAPTEGWARVRRPRAPGPALDYRNANLDGASDMPDPLPPPDIRVTTEPIDSNDAPSNAATSTSNHTNSALGSSSSTPANLNNTGLRTPGTSRTEQRERSNRSGSPAPSPPAAAQGSQASAEREGEPNTGPTQTGAESDSEEDAECSEDDSYDHVPYNGSSSAVAAAAANSGSLYQQRRREHDSTDDRYEYQDEGPLDPPPPYLSQEDVGDEVDEDFDVESKEVDYPESDT
jgi:hypothetical protein